MAQYHFRTVPPLTAPANASPGLVGLVSAVQQYAQTTVDQLGMGDPASAPDFSALITANNHPSLMDTTDTSALTTAYDNNTQQIADVKSKLVGLDSEVSNRAADVADIADSTWQKVKTQLTALQRQLSAAHLPADPKTLPSLEGPLIVGCLNTLNLISEDMQGANVTIQQHAIALAKAHPPVVTGGPGTGYTYSNGGSPQHYAPAAAVPLTSLGAGEQAKAKDIYQYLITQCHFTPAQAAGILGNMQVESGFDTGAKNGAEGAYGLCQWEGGRLQNLMSWAANNKLDPSKWQTQVQFMMHEMGGDESGALAQLKAANDPAAAAAAFDQFYERSSGDARGTRMSDAASIAQSMANVTA